MRDIANPRLLAFEALVEVELNGAYSNLVLPKLLSKSSLSTADKSLASELVYGSLRLKGRHDRYISRVSDRALEDIDPKALLVLRLGVHQLKELRVPSYAAINETVELAKRVVGKSTASFVNAILRKVDSVDVTELHESQDPQQNLSERYSHPEWIVSSYFDSLKDASQVAELLEANNVPAKPTLIAWPGLSTQDELCSAGATSVPYSKVAAVIDGDPGTIAAIRERRAGVQDYGSQLVSEIFLTTHESGLRWLDLCAGPGGKAAYISALLKIHGGEFVANEVSRARADLVAQVVHHGTVTNFDGRKIPSELGNFDRILLDAPCTGIGALRRRPEVRWRRTLQDLKNLTVLQAELLDSAAGSLRSGGILAYVTCSSHQAETTFQVRSFLRRHPHFRIKPIDDPRVDSDGNLQLWTHRDGCDSMFISLLMKVGAEG